VLERGEAGEEKVILWAHLFSIELNNPVETSEDRVGECKNGRGAHYISITLSNFLGQKYS